MEKSLLEKGLIGEGAVQRRGLLRESVLLQWQFTRVRHIKEGLILGILIHKELIKRTFERGLIREELGRGGLVREELGRGGLVREERAWLRWSC